MRLTVWQNIILSDIPNDDAFVEVGRSRAGFGSMHGSPRSATLVACTGNSGCRLAATKTTGQALALGD